MDGSKAPQSSSHAARRKIVVLGANALPIAESAAAIVSALQKLGHKTLPRRLLAAGLPVLERRLPFGFSPYAQNTKGISTLEASAN